MMSICEHTCGLCSADKCFDLAPDCHSLRALCFNRPMSPLFRQQCPLTCGLCQPVQQAHSDGNGPDGNMEKMPRELIVLVRKKIGQRQRCEDLSPSCSDNELLCNDEVIYLTHEILLVNLFRTIRRFYATNVPKHAVIAQMRKSRMKKRHWIPFSGFDITSNLRVRDHPYDSAVIAMTTTPISNDP